MYAPFFPVLTVKLRPKYMPRNSQRYAPEIPTGMPRNSHFYIKRVREREEGEIVFKRLGFRKPPLRSGFLIPFFFFKDSKRELCCSECFVAQGDHTG